MRTRETVDNRKTGAGFRGCPALCATYADGTSVSMTTPAASQNSSSSNDTTSNGPTAHGGSAGPGNNNSNLIEELIRLQSQLVTQAASALSTIA